MIKTTKYPDPTTCFTYAVTFILESINDENTTLDQIGRLNEYDLHEFAENSDPDIHWEYNFGEEDFDRALIFVKKFAYRVSTAD